MGTRAGIYLEITPKINKLIKTVEPYKTGFKKMMRQIRTHHFLYGYVHYDGDRIGDILAEKYTTTESILDLFLRTKLMCFEINNRGDDFRFSRNTNYPITVVRTPKYSLDYEEYKYIFTNGITWYVGSDYSDIKVNLTKFLRNEIKFAYQLNQSKSLMESFNGFAEDSLNESYVSLNQMSTFRSTSFENNTHNFGECINVLSPSIKLLDNKVIEKVLIIRDRRLNKEGDRDRTRHHIVLYIPDSFDDYDLTNRDFDYLLNLNDNALTSSLMKIWDLEPEYVVYAGYVEIEPNDTVYEPTYDERDIQKKLYDVIRKGYNRLKGYQKGHFKLEISKIL